MSNIFCVESIDWSSDCIWDAWLRGIFTSKEKVDEHLFSHRSVKDQERFRVLEIEPDSNIIVGGWIIIAGEGHYSWTLASPEDIRFMGR